MKFVTEDWGYRSDIEVIDALIEADNKFIIDAGCGNGELCRHLAGRGARMFGIEPDPVQSKKNSKAPVVANVGFQQAGAAKIPVEPNSADGVIFKNSLHHVYAPDYPAVFDEVKRILKGSGFLCVIEPIANGSHHHVMAPFHDETKVRHAAYQALVKFAYPAFSQMREIYYDVDNTYDSFDKYASHYEGLVYNNYEVDVRQPEVQKRFNACENSHGSFTLTQPMRANYFTRIKH